jgi:hypothetical protein
MTILTKEEKTEFVGDIQEFLDNDSVSCALMIYLDKDGIIISRNGTAIEILEIKKL